MSGGDAGFGLNELAGFEGEAAVDAEEVADDEGELGGAVIEDEAAGVEFVVDVGGGEGEEATDDGAAEFGGDVGGGGAGAEGGFGGVGGGERWDEDEEEGEEEKVHGAERTWGAGGMFWVGVRILEGTPRRLDGRRGEIR